MTERPETPGLRQFQELGRLVAAFRAQQGMTQNELAQSLGVSRSPVALFEQGVKPPASELVKAVCNHLSIPDEHWDFLVDEEQRAAVVFETHLSELVGRPVSLDSVDALSRAEVRRLVRRLQRDHLTPPQVRALFNRVLVGYGEDEVSDAFFSRFLGAAAFATDKALERAVRNFQSVAIRMFSTFRQAFRHLNACGDLDRELSTIGPRPLDSFFDRNEWDGIQELPEERLADLGYISASRIRKERAERELLAQSLREVANLIETDGPLSIEKLSTKKRSRIDSLIRQYDAPVEHGLISSLFSPDPDKLRRAAAEVLPETEDDLEQIEASQTVARRNLAHYLTADSLDVYVATSMRNRADFVSVDRFARGIFAHDDVAPLRLRYFNPTQSWIDDRVAKGLVEALMLRRSAVTVYMAQKTDTFGKDSEASVALGQGKPVIVYVPRLHDASLDLDTDAWSRMERPQLVELVELASDGDEEVDEAIDKWELLAKFLRLRLQELDPMSIAQIASAHWADFDLEGEAGRIKDGRVRAEYREWVDTFSAAPGAISEPSDSVAREARNVLTAAALNFERRAHLFREVHPLSLQVIFSSGVLNGIIVVRSLESCAQILRGVIENSLEFDLETLPDNYQLVERTTRSIVRVISRNRLIQNAFTAHYSR